ncbi:hypothetical protein [Xanthobacter dioxanivorans]|nr:hypothetical protein [Xanthobacter dioxanivorans]
MEGLLRPGLSALVDRVARRPLFRLPKPVLVAEIEPGESRSLALAMLMEANGTEGLVPGAPIVIGFAADANGWTYPVARLLPETSGTPDASLAGERAGHDR